MVVVSDKGKEAILDYELVDYKNNLSLVKIFLKTGRSHQIRVQFSAIGNPSYGDGKYGAPDGEKQTVNLALWASGLEFKHPTLDQTMVFKVNPPEENYPFSLFKDVFKKELS